MVNKDLEDLYKAAADESHVTALRMIYDIGYADGAGQTITAISSSPAATRARPSDATIAVAKTVTKRK